jgi:prophage antirepressor-like protein
MTALDILKYEGQRLRHIIIDDEPWFVAADVCAILEIGNPTMAVARLDDDETTLISTEGRPFNAVSEAGLFALILGSRKPEARAFRRWVTHEVLPMIRKTGSYALSEDEIVHQALAITSRKVKELEARVTELVPRADAWDELASAEGDYSVADAAKILARAGVKTGPQRLFEQLSWFRWIHRGHDGKWRAYASAVDDGYLAEKPQSHHHPRTGELVLDSPQVRVTVRGLERLRVRLGSLELAPTG